MIRRGWMGRTTNHDTVLVQSDEVPLMPRRVVGKVSACWDLFWTFTMISEIQQYDDHSLALFTVPGAGGLD